MPYSNEVANPSGFEAVLTDGFIADRLKTYSFSREGTREFLGAADLLKLIPAAELKPRRPLAAYTHGFAIDGSLVKASDDFPFELAALKVGFVTQDLNHQRSLRSKQVLEEGDLAALYTLGDRPALISGQGVYDRSSGGTWRDKFRMEFFENVREIMVPQALAPTTLLDVVKALIPAERTMDCLSCKEMGIVLRPEDRLSVTARSCPKCMADLHPTDALFYSSQIGSSLANSVMLTLERLAMHGTIMEAARNNSFLDLSTTVFVLDGPLGIFDSTSILNQYILRELQTLPEAPVLMGLEKGGEINKFARSPMVEARMAPGMVAMLTDDAANALRNSTNKGRHYFYGKRFFYRSLNGEKLFVLALPPTSGDPYELEEGDGWADEWENYPTLATAIEYLEEHAIDRFGSQEASVDIIAEANHAASLPKTLSEKFLKELIVEAEDRRG